MMKSKKNFQKKKIRFSDHRFKTFFEIGSRKLDRLALEKVAAMYSLIQGRSLPEAPGALLSGVEHSESMKS
jgi:hypothetical protein